jgi:NAD(P)-dependent dehydrogenase (short-subunit alcohol dehydrogenase family)
MTHSLNSKIALVTGASRGIGKEICLALAEAGADVICAATTRENAEATAADVRGIGRQAWALGARVEQQAQVRELFEAAEREAGRVDILVNNAGIPNVQPILDMTEADWQRVLGVNLMGSIFCAQEAARRMRDRGTGGVIIHIGSVAGINGLPLRSAYAASKAAIHHLTKIMALEWADYQIRVNCIAPGYIRTGIMENLIRQGKLDIAKVEARVPMHRAGKPREIAEAAVFLASDASSYMTGSVIIIDGGFHANGFL